MKSKKKNEGSLPKLKNKGLFDHIREIRQNKSPEYYRELSDSDRKTFNLWMILKGLSMDRNLIEDVALLYQYINVIPSENFYKLLCDLVPNSSEYHKWIKSSNKIQFKPELVNLIVNHYKVSEWQAKEYLNLFVRNDFGIKELISLVSKYGYTEKEIENLIDGGTSDD